MTLVSRVRSMLAAVCLMLPAACGTLNKPYPAKESFGLHVADPGPAGITRPVPLRVERVRVAAPYDDRSFIHRLSDTRFQSDYYAEFIADPEPLLTSNLVRALAASKVFAAIVEPSGAADAPFRLETTVTDMYADVRDPASPAVVFRTRHLLLRDMQDATVVAGEWVLQAREPAASAAPSDVAAAFAGAYARVLTDLIKALSDPSLDIPTAGAR